jgi:hypothetical protein
MDRPKTLKIGQTSDPETLVIHQKLTPGNNPKNFKQYYDHGGSLQLHIGQNSLSPFASMRTRLKSVIEQIEREHPVHYFFQLLSFGVLCVRSLWLNWDSQILSDRSTASTSSAIETTGTSARTQVVSSALQCPRANGAPQPPPPPKKKFLSKTKPIRSTVTLQPRSLFGRLFSVPKIDSLKRRRLETQAKYKTR